MAANKTIPAFVLGAVVGGAIAYFGLTNPPGDALTGTVAPAERYRAEQISGTDIELGDQTLQEFMQTDVYTTLVNDPAFRTAVASDAFRSMIASEAFLVALNSDTFRMEFSKAAFGQALASDTFRADLATEIGEDPSGELAVAGTDETPRGAHAESQVDLGSGLLSCGL